MGLGLQVGAMLGQVGLQLGLILRFLAFFGRSGRLELVLNFNKSRFYSAGDQKYRPGGLQARFWSPPAVILAGLGEPEGYFLKDFLHNLLLLKFKVSST